MTTIGMRITAAVIALWCGVTMTGCPAVVVGAGAGAGVYTYSQGNLTRTYQATFNETLNASMQTFEALRMTVTQKPTGDALKSVVKAERSDGTPITLKIAMVAPNITEVSVRSGYVGYWDRDVSKLIHANIANRLQ